MGRATTGKAGSELVDGIERLKMHGEIYLAGEAPYFSDPDVDISCDLSMWISCNSDNTQPTFNLHTSNLSVSANFDLALKLLGVVLAPGGLVALSALEYIENTIEVAVMAGWVDLSEEFALPELGFCPRLLMPDEADGSFTVRVDI